MALHLLMNITFEDLTMMLLLDLQTRQVSTKTREQITNITALLSLMNITSGDLTTMLS